MDEQKHTPGPWYGRATDGTGQGVIYDEETGVAVAVAFNSKDTLLIAAAPGLLEACEAFVRHIETMPDDTEKGRILGLALNNRAGDMIRAGEMIRAAIAKATGK
jgi:hypothetical protein